MVLFDRIAARAGTRISPARLGCHAAAWVALVGTTACTRGELTAKEKEQIARDLRAQVVAAYDFSSPGAVDRLMSLYPRSGPVYSAGAGHFTASRDSLAEGIAQFWDNVGQNMQQPRWEWTAMQIDVLSRDAAVMTATYRVPHLTPRGEPHVIGGAWTAVFARRDGRWEIVHEHLSDVPVLSDTAVRAAADTGSDAHAGH